MSLSSINASISLIKWKCECSQVSCLWLNYWLTIHQFSSILLSISVVVSTEKSINLTSNKIIFTTGLQKMNSLMTKPAEWHVCPVKTQIRHLPSLISLGSLATHWAHSEDWSDWTDAQADPSLRWAHSHFVGFVMRRPKCLSSWFSGFQIWNEKEYDIKYIKVGLIFSHTWMGHGHLSSNSSDTPKFG